MGKKRNSHICITPFDVLNTLTYDDDFNHIWGTLVIFFVSISKLYGKQCIS